MDHSAIDCFQVTHVVLVKYHAKSARAILTLLSVHVIDES